ncbi:MAG: efflux RND transporter periplasmic adaptor subunit [Bacteroidia bacterium]
MNKSIWQISLAIAVCFSACTSNKEEEKSEEATFTVTSPIVIDTSFTKEYVAQIQSLQNIEIRAQVQGYLESINVDEGQQVHAGQVLFNIMPKQYQAELAKAKAEAKASEIELQNVKTLNEKNIVSPSEVAMAQSKFDAAKADQAIAELHVSFTEIKAPFDGVIDRIKFKVGSLIDAGNLLTTLSNNKDVYAYFNISEVEYLNYKANNNGNVKGNATLLLANNLEHKYKGTVETIESEFNNTTGNIDFRAKFPNPDLLLKNGETGKVRLVVVLKGALVIPQKATYEIQDKDYVYVVDKNNLIKSRCITITHKLPNLYVIGSGLTVTDKILLEGIQNVKEDDKIKTKFEQPEVVLSSLQLIK